MKIALPYPPSRPRQTLPAILLACGLGTAHAAATDLAITLTAAPNPVIVNGPLTYTMEVRNQGTAPARQILVKSALPGGAQFDSASPGCKLAKNKVFKCKAKRLSPGVTARWSFVVRPQGEGQFTASARVKSNTRDRNKSNNVASATATASMNVNQQPVANDASLSVVASEHFVVQRLIAADADSDTLTFELLAPPSGTGYSEAAIDPNTGVFTVTLDPNFSGTLTFPYHATDGMAFSNTASVTLIVSPSLQSQKAKGSTAIDAKTYANAVSSRVTGDLQGSPDGQPTVPHSVDLSPFFPTPGDQGQQNSCVGWATAYALKSFQEGRTYDWSLDTSTHVFSPAYVYNQINNGVDQGSRIDLALQLMVDQGAATWDFMPYNPHDFLTQPSSEARAEAAQYRAKSWSRVNGTDAMKAALVNRQPVVIGITACDSFLRLAGANSVYTTLDGSCGGHAVTVVGYDDNQDGGAFKAINSWGLYWGNSGFFWLPYDFASQAILFAFTLEDQENGPATAAAPPTGNLPNLEIQDFKASYNAMAGGGGKLEYSVVNTGTGTAASGFNVNLMLSDNPSISTNDIYVVFESVPIDIQPGFGITRNNANPISFSFPSYVPPGTYYLALWVDDLNVVAESNENDNIALSQGVVQMAQGLPDLRIDTWHATASQGEGTLTFTILNAGVIDAPPGWETRLVLSPDSVIGNGNEITLFNYPVNITLPAGYTASLDNNAPARFQFAPPPGSYYLALWADSQNQIAESNEANNISVGGNPVQVGSSAPSPAAGMGSGLRSAHVSRDGGDSYNGKRLPVGRKVSALKIQVAASPDGQRDIKVLEEVAAPLVKPMDDPMLPKTTRARNKAIFPTQGWFSMPKLD